MSNPWDLLPASLWPTGPLVPPFGPGQGAILPQAPAAPPERPSFALDYTTPEAAEVLRQWAEPHAARAESRTLGVQELPHPAADRYQQMLADAKASHDLMIGLLGLASVAPRLAAKQAADAQVQPVPSPATQDEQGQHKPAARSSEAGRAD